jgi:hypothetical protein
MPMLLWECRNLFLAPAPASALPCVPCLPADELKYDLHVLLVRHGKECPACAKAGSAKQRGAKAAAAGGGGGFDCPLAELKPPKSQLKAMSPVGQGKKQQRSKDGREAAAAVAAAAAATGSSGAPAAAPNGGSGKRRKVPLAADPSAEPQIV